MEIIHKFTLNASIEIISIFCPYGFDGCNFNSLCDGGASGPPWLRLLH